MERDEALADFERARAEWETAFARVPDAALTYLKPGDDYALGGLEVHVNRVLIDYLALLQSLVTAGDAELRREVDADAARRALARAREGLLPSERQEAVGEMSRLHEAVRATAATLSDSEWLHKTQVVYGPGQDALPTSPDDVLGWLRDHYREHVVQSADLIEDWRASTAAG